MCVSESNNLLQWMIQRLQNSTFMAYEILVKDLHLLFYAQFQLAFDQLTTIWDQHLSHICMSSGWGIKRKEHYRWHDNGDPCHGASTPDIEYHPMEYHSVFMIVQARLKGQLSIWRWGYIWAGLHTIEAWDKCVTYWDIKWGHISLSGAASQG